MVNKDFIIYLYGFSTTLTSKLINLVKIVENQLEHDNQISFVFIHDGVIGTTQRSRKSQVLKKLLDLPLIFYSLIPDLKARGIDSKNLQNKITGIDYSELVDILAKTPKIVSWM